ncbi:MAG TPA: hypothetical protein VHO84_15195 [Syntrophorhabdaceae bacterium]|nr:hypothetical protein [Syntrophorhabdaceae bacterium]
MAQPKHLICGIHITERVRHAVPVQQILTEFGRNIKTRLGLHEISSTDEGPNGMLLVEFVGSEDSFGDFLQKLNTVEGVEVKQMIFDHP